MENTKNFNLWPQGKELVLINGENFDKNELLSKLNWTGIAGKTVTDAESIRVRQDGLKLFMSSSIMSRFVKDSYFDAGRYTGKDFFKKYGTASKFNRKTNGMIHALRATIANPEFKPTTDVYPDILNYLSDKFKETLVIENDIVEKVKRELNSVYSYNGVVKISGALNEESEQKIKDDVYGFRDYLFHSEDPWFVKWSKAVINFYGYPKRKNLNRFKEFMFLLFLKIPLLFLYIPSSILIAFNEKNRNDALYTRELPHTVKSEIFRINKDFVTNVRGKLKEKLELMELSENRIEVIEKSVLINTEFQFSLNPETGFIIRLIDVNYKISVSDESVDTVNTNWGDPFAIPDTFFDKGTSFYSKIKKRILRVRAQRLSNRAAYKFVKLPMMHAVEGALVLSKDLLSRGTGTVLRESYLKMMDELKYSCVADTIHGLNLDSNWNKVVEFREEVRYLFSQLKNICEKSKTIISTREKFSDLPFCFPTILDDDKNLVSFDNLSPLHLIGRKNKDRSKELSKQDLRLIVGVPALNGQMVAITGQNGGGKTVVETELIHTMYLAHMGLPVFAEHFTMNAKEIIAMVFVEKGEGSMLQLIMEKLKIVAEAVEKNPNNKIVVIIDELLTGTQEGDGYDIGREYLKMLSNKKCSVMFATQITQLAEYAKRDLGALCYYFKSDGSMGEGIGKGNARVLAEEVGLDKFLVSK